MKIKFGISIKFSLLIFVTLSLLIIALTLANVLDQKTYFEEKLNEQTYIYAQALDNNFGNLSFLNNKNKTGDAVDAFMEKNSRISNFNIILYDEDHVLRIFESSFPLFTSFRTSLFSG